MSNPFLGFQPVLALLGYIPQSSRPRPWVEPIDCRRLVGAGEQSAGVERTSPGNETTDCALQKLSKTRSKNGNYVDSGCNETRD